MTTAKKEHNPYLHFIAGGVGGTVGAVITCPLEVVKTRLQSSLYKNQQNIGLVKMVSEIKRTEGLRGLWKGIGPNLFGVIPARAIYFSTYSSTKDYLTNGIQINKGHESPFIHALSACIAGFTTSTISNPIWLVKTRMQLQNQNDYRDSKNYIKINKTTKTLKETAHLSQAGFSTITTSNNINGPGVYYKNSFQCFKDVVRKEGIHGLFRGLTASYLGVFESSIQWVTYEGLKRNFRVNDENQNTSPSLTSCFIMAAFSKFFASTITYPHEVIRTRMRQQVGNLKYSTLTKSIKIIFKEEGILAFYSGITAHLLRTVPNAAIMFLCYESVIYIFEK
jgi:solute carrier family 25 protein 33/36